MNRKHLNPNFKTILNKYKIKKGFNNERCKINYASQIDFAAAWKSQFGNDLKRRTFYTPHGEVTALMMHDKREVYIAQGDGFRVLALPYKTGDIFYIILPDSVGKNAEKGMRNYWEENVKDTFSATENAENNEQDEEKNQQTPAISSLDEVLAHLTPESLNLKFERHEMTIEIPKFEFSESVSFTPVLAALGLENLFQRGNAELNKVLSDNAKDDEVCAPKDIFVEEIRQKNKIKVDEKGTVAISLQMIVFNYATGDRIDAPFIVDRPFIFMINNGAFVGIINDPTQKE